MLPTKFQFIWESGFRVEDFFQKSTNQKKEWPVAAMFVNGLELNEQSLQRTFQGYFLSRFDSFGLMVSEEIFLNQPIRNKNGLWWSCLLTDRDKMSTLYREPSKDASYQVLIHLPRWFQRRRFSEIDRSETRTACGGHVCLWIGTKLAIFTEDLPQMLPAMFRIIWPHSFRGEEF